MSFFNKLYKFVFRKKVQKEYDALLVEKNKIEAEIAEIREKTADKLKELVDAQSGPNRWQWIYL